nr:catalase [Piscinibacter sakaiensis]
MPDPQDPAALAGAPTDSGPAHRPARPAADPAVEALRQQDALAAAFPFNPTKASEYGAPDAPTPPGATAPPPSRLASASTVSETVVSDKVGSSAPPGSQPAAGPLDRVRVDSTGCPLTTNQGVPVADNQHSLRAGLRGPALLEDFILREKLTHFDHERIPERIVHARGSGAHGRFVCTRSLAALTQAAPFRSEGKTTPVFVRFSTVAGERGSKDTARDVRGFAVKFYTEEGNWDLVGNNMPVFFIQDAMKFPDLVHALKPEPHHAMPQAASAHDTFWDFVSLMPESTHMLMWLMSDRAIPRSYRMMQGFGVHTFRFVNDSGESVLVKFHWLPLLGTHSLVWDEAVKIAGADPDFHRRDLWEAIEAGEPAQWDLAVQVFTEEEAARFSFDVLDATKIVPEELVPLQTVGRLVLDRNPDNFFAETEQVAFCTAHVIPGIDFTNDPLLAGRIHSYVDTQLTRLGGPNFHELPINAPLAPVHNNQRDGLHRQAIPRGRVAYEPNSLAGGCPFQAGSVQGFASVARRLDAGEGAEKLRAKPEKFAEHHAQARLFYDSQTPVEQAHIASAFRFELSKLTVPAVRQRMVATLRHVSEELAARVAQGLGMPLPEAPPRLDAGEPPEVRRSLALSLRARPGDGGVRTRKVAALVADGCDAAALQAVRAAVVAAGAVLRCVGPHVGALRAQGGEAVDADASLENEPAVLFDAVVLPDGEAAVQALAENGLAAEFVRDQYRHGKPLLALGAAQSLLGLFGVPGSLPDGAADPGVLAAPQPADHAAALDAFLAVLGTHRIGERETDPPRL